MDGEGWCQWGSSGRWVGLGDRDGSIKGVCMGEWGGGDWGGRGSMGWRRVTSLRPE